MKTRLMMVGLVGVSLAGCNTTGGLFGHDEFSNYLERKDTVTMSAGEASRVNAATHTNNYWPPYVADRNIEVRAARLIPAIECVDKRDGAGKPVTTSQTNTNIDVKSGTATSQTNSKTENKC